ncbi:sigma factor-like helix-turn-helix DNA-binding protein [Streptomyces malaysiense]|uniref:RNA polymerase subunit sigma-70 n=1 Tax=Streptomyces malaysiense TaxID=1428626 RepID=A0A1J4Q2B4_9ACTN|nr:sigma factor-like helix-turn-helix DNA-binding protein [Streptomyces malaysiense]OIK27145.1 RNA polymerase subunit sigma-70 [Streptomyces malaysiense]
MRDRRVVRGTDRAQEFEAFVAGAAGRLLLAATLLTAEAPDANPRARRLLTLALGHTYARWHRLRGEDPYDCARQYLAVRFARTIWHRHRFPGRARPEPRGPLAGLNPQERLVLVLRMYEGVAEEQTAALLGLTAERVHTVCDRATSLVLHPVGAAGPRPVNAEVAPS